MKGGNLLMSEGIPDAMSSQSLDGLRVSTSPVCTTRRGYSVSDGWSWAAYLANASNNSMRNATGVLVSEEKACLGPGERVRVFLLREAPEQD